MFANTGSKHKLPEVPDCHKTRPAKHRLDVDVFKMTVYAPVIT